MGGSNFCAGVRRDPIIVQPQLHTGPVNGIAIAGVTAEVSCRVITAQVPRQSTRAEEPNALRKTTRRALRLLLPLGVRRRPTCAYPQSCDRRSTLSARRLRARAASRIASPVRR